MYPAAEKMKVFVIAVTAKHASMGTDEMRSINANLKFISIADKIINEEDVIVINNIDLIIVITNKLLSLARSPRETYAPSCGSFAFTQLMLMLDRAPKIAIVIPMRPASTAPW